MGLQGSSEEVTTMYQEHGKPDVQVENHGSLFLFRPLSDFAADWIEENVNGEAQFFGGALVVEPRYAGELAEGMVEAGLQLS